MKLQLNIETISDTLYLLLLEEFKKEAEANGIDLDTIEDQYWELSLNL